MYTFLFYYPSNMSRNYELPSIICKPAKRKNENQSWSNDLVVKEPATKPDDRCSIPERAPASCALTSTHVHLTSPTAREIDK